MTTRTLTSQTQGLTSSTTLNINNVNFSQLSLDEIQQYQKNVRTAAINVLKHNKKKHSIVKSNLRNIFYKLPQKTRNFQIEDIYYQENRPTIFQNNSENDSQLENDSEYNQQQEKKQQIKSLIEKSNNVLHEYNINKSQGQNSEQGDFYYTIDNEVLSVREFMYRLESLNNSKQFEGKLEEIRKRKDKIQMVQEQLQARSIRAAQYQCFEGLKKRLQEENIVIGDEELMEMIKQLNFKAEKNLKMTSREADRQLISFILGGDQERKRRNIKQQKLIDRTYQKISNPLLFDIFSQRLVKLKKHKEQQLQQNNSQQSQQQQQQSISSTTKHQNFFLSQQQQEDFEPLSIAKSQSQTPLSKNFQNKFSLSQTYDNKNKIQSLSKNQSNSFQNAARSTTMQSSNKNQYSTDRIMRGGSQQVNHSQFSVRSSSAKKLRNQSMTNRPQSAVSQFSQKTKRPQSGVPSKFEQQQYRYIIYKNPIASFPRKIYKDKEYI